MGSPAPDDLDGTAWVLTRAHGLGVPPGVAITARFEGGRVGGSAGVNRYGAPVQVTGGTLTVGDALTTCMAGPPDAMRAERAYLAALAAVRTWHVDPSGTLVLADGGGRPLLELAPEPATPAGDYEVTGYLDAARDAFVAVLDGTHVTLAPTPDGDVRGHAGCNRFGGTYTHDGPAIALGPLATTRAHCPQPAGVMEQERTFLAALAATTRFEREAGTLTLLDGAGRATVRARPR